MANFSIFKSDANGEFRYRLFADNTEIVLSGEGYKSKQSCNEGIQSAKINSQYDFRYEKSDKPGNYRFNLKASNGEIIGVSEGYTTSYSRDEGIKVVKRLAPNAIIQDLS